MKKLTVFFLMLIAASLITKQSSANSHQIDLNDFGGMWKFTVKVPSQYDRKGTLNVTIEDDQPSVKFIAENGDEIKTTNVAFEDDQLKISFDYNYSSYTMKLNKDGADKLKGVVITPQGQNLDVTANRKKMDSKDSQN